MVFSSTFELQFGVRQVSVLSPVLFAVYIDDIAVLSVPRHGMNVILYADDIMLIALSVWTRRASSSVLVRQGYASN